MRTNPRLLLPPELVPGVTMRQLVALRDNTKAQIESARVRKEQAWQRREREERLAREIAERKAFLETPEGRAAEKAGADAAAQRSLDWVKTEGRALLALLELCVPKSSLIHA